LKDQPVHRVHPGRKAIRVSKVPLARRALLESLDLQALRDHLVRRGSLDLQVQQGRKDHLDHLDHLDRLAQ